MQGKHKDSLAWMYIRNSDGVSSCKTDFFETRKLNFPTETDILFHLKYLIFKIYKINSLSFKLKSKTKIMTRKQPKHTKQKKLNKQVYCIFKRTQLMQLLFTKIIYFLT